jgi:hypothetical protein
MTNTNPTPSYTSAVIPETYDFRRVLILLAMVGLIWALGKVVYTYAFPTKTPLEMCQESYMESVNVIYRENEQTARKCTEDYGGDIYKLNKCTSSPLPTPVNTCWTTMNATGGIAPVPPSTPTLRAEFWLKDCRFTNKDHRMNKYHLNWTAYDIACEKWVAFDVKSPWNYVIEKIGHWANMGDYVILKNEWDFRIVIAHLQTSRKVGELLHKGDVIWQTNLSWLSTGMHVHIELWYQYFILSSEAIYGWEHTRENQWALLKHRNWDFWQPKEEPYYFTAYNLWDLKQNDSTPCIGASGIDLCALEASGVRTMALTADIRNRYKVKFGEKIKLTGEPWCEGEYEVHDEMNIRFRQTPGIRRPWTSYFIKWDLPSKPGWVCFITKL